MPGCLVLGFAAVTCFDDGGHVPCAVCFELDCSTDRAGNNDICSECCASAASTKPGRGRGLGKGHVHDGLLGLLQAELFLGRQREREPTGAGL